MIREWERTLFYAVLTAGILALVSVWMVEAPSTLVAYEPSNASRALSSGDFAGNWDVRESEPYVELTDNPMKARLPLRLQSNPPSINPFLPKPPPLPPAGPTVVKTPPPVPAPTVDHAIHYLGYMKVSGTETLPYLRCVRRVNGKPVAAETVFVRVGQNMLGCQVLACDRDGMTIKDRHGRIVTVNRNDLVTLGD